ncbi:MAG: Rpn family recombination-promoting nuclease/putative transposase [Lachnospiraceae bacterium]|nr:Rpn family recombination-promoting nuclease/putative transposase [Lachnospiraceae bacterium]
MKEKMNESTNEKEARNELTSGFQMKPYEELTIVDNFMFTKVMSNPEICKTFLEIVLDVKIKEISYPEDEKTITIASESKSVRLDVYVDDDQGTVYNVEMQSSMKNNLPKRSRYYQAMIDLQLLDKGADYNELNKSYIIFICTFDLFGQGRHIYRFKNCCLECPDLVLEDDTTKIFINTKGIQDDISDEFREMIKVFNGEDGQSEYAKKLMHNVDEIRLNKKWRREYMQLWEIEKERYQEGLARGHEAGLAEGHEAGLAEGRKEKDQTFVPLLIEMSLKLTGNEENSINEVADSVPNLSIDEVRSVWYEYKKNKDNRAQ